MKNLKKLSRNQLKNLKGGQACMVVIKMPSGKYERVFGTCKTLVSTTQITDTFSVPTTTSYCETGLGQLTLTSNGGQSRC